MVKLTVVIEVDEQSREAWNQVNSALHDFNVASMTWGEPAPPAPQQQRVATKPEDLGSRLSQTIDRETGVR